MSDVAMPDPWDPSLGGLPDELLQEIFGYLRPKRWRPSLGDNMGPYGPDDDDRSRKTALGAICRTSRRFSRIATPLFYADIHVTREGNAAIGQMTRLFRTLGTHPEFANCIKFIHNPRILGRTTVNSNEQKLAMKEALRSRQPYIAKAVWNARAVDLWIDGYIVSIGGQKRSLEACKALFSINHNCKRKFRSHYVVSLRL
jgi:hypothetical protein